MLVLSRKLGEQIYIGEEVKITVVEVHSGRVKIGIEAPTHVPIVRSELMDQMEHCETATR